MTSLSHIIIYASTMLDGFMLVLTPGIFAVRSGSLFLHYLESALPVMAFLLNV